MALAILVRATRAAIITAQILKLCTNEIETSAISPAAAHQRIEMVCDLGRSDRSTSIRKLRKREQQRDKRCKNDSQCTASKPFYNFYAHQAHPFQPKP